MFPSAWIPNTELAPLDVGSEAVTNPVEKGKSKSLLQAYKKAADNEDLDHFKAMLADHKKAVEADEKEREELEKERAAKKAKKASRKSEATVDDEDEMDIDEDVPPAKPRSKKRKKADDSEDMDEKVGLISLELKSCTIADYPSLRRPLRPPQSSSCLPQKPQLRRLLPKRRLQKLRVLRPRKMKAKTML